MVRRSSASFRLSLVAVLFGLSALFAAHGRETAQHVGVSYADVTPPSLGIRSSRGGKPVRVARFRRDPVVFGASPLVPGHLQHVSHLQTVRVLPRASAPGSLFQATCVVAPNPGENLLARENVLALGGAPRAPGPSRAPPAA